MMIVITVVLRAWSCSWLMTVSVGEDVHGREDAGMFGDYPTCSQPSCISKRHNLSNINRPREGADTDLLRFQEFVDVLVHVT